MRLTDFMGSFSRQTIIILGLLLVLLLGVVDFLNGPEVSFLLFHTAPVILAAWYAGRRAAFAVCGASGLLWLAVAYATSGHFAHPFIAYWNVAVRLGFMFVLAHIVAAFRDSHAHERELARTDYLTGAVNWRYFNELAEGEINRARRHAHPFSVAYMDVDDFKLVNDRHGHSAGDRLLKTIADGLRANVRAVDTVARLGGDEFAVLMPETGQAAAQVVIRRVRRRLLEAARREGWPVTLSIGVVTWEEPPRSVDEMLRAADGLMYSAKRLGKNTIRHSVSHNPANAA
ncbi:MAG TPA: GGDEF domain-containing protein [Pyrinomonadaceae bacterium]|nr:GGDEF domain-containing protein [Pyrinomonadaceae bacterium]